VSLGADAADKRVRCPRCNWLLKIPRLEDLSEALRMVEQAKGTIYVDEEGKIYA
jgi:hypothetical protein